MKKTVGCFTDEKLRQLAEQPNVTVMQPTHDIVYEPWTANRVSECVDRLVQYTRGGMTPDAIREESPELADFASKYTIFFQKLTDPAFANDRGHIETVKRLIALRSAVEQGALSDVDAHAQSSDVALKSLVARVRPDQRP